jgi:hypothetical protein
MHAELHLALSAVLVAHAVHLRADEEEEESGLHDVHKATRSDVRPRPWADSATDPVWGPHCHFESYVLRPS